MDFQLQRLILIDSFSPGRVVIFPLEGGAVLTGRNGRGKTSLLQLLPVFFGEKGRKWVFARKQSANTKRQGEGPYPKGLPLWPGRGNGVNG
jgi:hypothetical protein